MGIDTSAIGDNPLIPPPLFPRKRGKRGGEQGERGLARLAVYLQGNSS